MPLRDHLVVVLAREILGPRDGTFERIVGPENGLPPDPSDEYVIGVLEPRGYTRGIFEHFGRPQLTGPQTIIRMDEWEEPDEEEDYDSGTNPIEINPQLDPRALPKSIGLSFVVASNKDARISVCATWGRYSKEANSWQRTPHSFLRRGIRLESDDSWTSEQDSGVRLYLRRIDVAEGLHVSMYLVNETPLSDRRPQVEELVFQPQIRVVCDDGTRLIAIRGEQEEEADPQGLAFLYRNKYALARGHLCGAVWREVDPERATVGGNEDNGPPFSWIDGQTLPEEDRCYFTCPDARTDFLPTYSVEQASFNGPPSEHLEEIASEVLADMWQPEDLLRALRPILDAYERWIAATRRAAGSDIREQYREIATRNIRLCERALNRMREGLDLLRDDPDVRLSFCFMNKVMHQQSIWRDHNNPLRWRLFQIAFILQCISGIAQNAHPDRLLCDLLWFPTGAGKTEAYLGLAAFAIALRRRIAKRNKRPSLQAGMVVISRYTLRLLTIQQFRRALAVITACEYFRCSAWLPRGHMKEDSPWGTVRFSIGLWVGAGVTPNRLMSFRGYDRVKNRQVLYLGAVGELEGRSRWRASSAVHVEGEESEPAQVLNCPACRSILAVSPTTLVPGVHEIHWTISGRGRLAPPDQTRFRHYLGLSVRAVNITPLPNGRSSVVSVELEVAPRSEIRPDTVDAWWKEIIKPVIDPTCVDEFARPSRPGYFFRKSSRLTQEPIDFEIHCPNPRCDLNTVEWSETIPARDQLLQTHILPTFQIPDRAAIGHGLPIPAYTVDDQIYARCPSVMVSTVDKFARLGFEPRAASISGYVTHYDSEWGYYREGVPPETGSVETGQSYIVDRFIPPSLIIQDELHLIEGPLGTMVGLYENAMEVLTSSTNNGRMIRAKYVASTATIRQADSQVRAIFDRELAQFPPPGISADDSFFAISREPHQLESERPGRIYIGVCTLGRGVQTPIIRIWSAIIHEMARIRQARGGGEPESDQYWTLVGYFNAKKELAGTVGLSKADMPERLRILAGRTGWSPRLPLNSIELSGRTASFDIPGKLDRLARFPDNDIDAVFATAMFGTGVDIDRLGLMVVHGQPKTTGNYIQATGRVGRQRGGLVITFLRASRPRDLDHYEFFVGYHRALHRHVEPVTVFPFSPRARERGLGPLAVSILRNAQEIGGIPVSPDWGPESRRRGNVIPQSGSRIMATRRNYADVAALIEFLESRAGIQPEGRNPGPEVCRREISSWLDRWASYARLYSDCLIYYESTLTREARSTVVLGDPGHEGRIPAPVFRNAPQSLRDVEATTTFDDEE